MKHPEARREEVAGGEDPTKRAEAVHKERSSRVSTRNQPLALYIYSVSRRTTKKDRRSRRTRRG